MKTPTDALWFYGCNFIVLRSSTCFGHSCGHLQGAENKNTDIIKICRKSLHSSKSNIFWLKFTVK